MPEPLGLIAGEGVFPILVARGARASGRRVVCAALAGSAWPELCKEVDVHRTVGLLRPGQWVKLLKENGCREAILVGRVAKARMYDRWRYLRYLPDARALRMWFTRLRHDKRPQAVLTALCDELNSEGITLIDSSAFCADQLAGPGVMTRQQPAERHRIDARYGFDLCRHLSRMDIGQALAVIDRDVIAVEALEGTNAMIERAGQLCPSGDWTLIKVGNTHGDMRLDLPSIGTTTIEKMRSAGAKCLAVEAGKTILLEKPKVLELADRYRIAIVGLTA